MDRIKILDISMIVFNVALLIGLIAGCVYSHNFLLIVKKGDNIPIVGMIFLVNGTIWTSLRQGFRADQLIREGRRAEMYKEMCE